VAFLGLRRTHDDVVAPTLDDPVARAASGVVGGPLGRHAFAGRSWWTALRVTLALATITFGLGVIQKGSCVAQAWGDIPAPYSFSHLCYSDIQFLYTGRGLAEGIIPYQPLDDLPEVKQPATEQEARELTIEYPVLSGIWMGAAALVTHVLGEAPDLSMMPHASVASDLRAQHDSAIFWGVNAVGFFAVLLIGLSLLVRAQPRRPWDAVFIAASPCLALAAMINWDLIAFGFVAGFLWAWATRRPVVAGIFIGLGVATKLYPLFFLGPLLVLCLRERKLGTFVTTSVAAAVTWLVIDLPIYLWSPDGFSWFWKFNSSRGPDFGSLWLVASNYGHTATPHVINLTTWLLFGAACLAIGAVGLLAPRRPRLVQLMFLVIVAFLVINKVYSPQYVIWLLPLVALARPRWRDVLIWQACEVFYFFAVWMHIADFFVSAGAHDWVYALAIFVRIAGELFIAVLVIRDIFSPWHDPVRADGLSDDPLGGILDEGVDAEYAAAERAQWEHWSEQDEDVVAAR
jgi:uncharacterized membrane protein